MADFILITGDLAMFTPTFGQAIVTVRPGNLVGTGKSKINYKPVCVDGDEKKVIVPGCPYMTPQYSICLLYTSPSPRDRSLSRMPSSA